jgi:hypothetical protein
VRRQPSGLHIAAADCTPEFQAGACETGKSQELTLDPEHLAADLHAANTEVFISRVLVMSAVRKLST